ncbi:hypothetical protein FHW18_000029 [Pigmentiphaga litoralis]|uniref:Uncharacterized protein n=1 Tax=Pigmentiphaga litoralis TaxID=516702 RepID=A0A7Y9LL72_9BURK|nr:hypothetical protein [Pigmentiphaga litoralis]NYE80758.1 hypothetical protein [Pigmentiphaga litoralis]
MPRLPFPHRRASRLRPQRLPSQLRPRRPSFRRPRRQQRPRCHLRLRLPRRQCLRLPRRQCLRPQLLLRQHRHLRPQRRRHLRQQPHRHPRPQRRQSQHRHREFRDPRQHRVLLLLPRHLPRRMRHSHAASPFRRHRRWLRRALSPPLLLRLLPPLRRFSRPRLLRPPRLRCKGIVPLPQRRQRPQNRCLQSRALRPLSRLSP